MSDEPSGSYQPWPDGPTAMGPEDAPDVIRMGSARSTRSTRPIGPLILRSRSRSPYIVAGVAVAALLAGGGVALAGTSSGTPTGTPSAVAARPTPSPSPGTGRFGAGHHYWGGPGFGFGGLFGTVHGQFVVAKSGGGYETVDVQTGKVTAVSSTSITLKSTDGFTHTYVITSSTIVDAQRDGIGSVKAGNEATLMATVSGGTATATSIQDVTLLQQGRPSFGYPSQGASGAPSAKSG
jgi:hypothetical protein